MALAVAVVAQTVHVDLDAEALPGDVALLAGYTEALQGLHTVREFAVEEVQGISIGAGLATGVLVFETSIDDAGLAGRNVEEWSTAGYYSTIDVVASWEFLQAVAVEIQVVSLQAGNTVVLIIVLRTVLINSNAFLPSEYVVLLTGLALIVFDDGTPGQSTHSTLENEAGVVALYTPIHIVLDASLNDTLLIPPEEGLVACHTLSRIILAPRFDLHTLILAPGEIEPTLTLTTVPTIIHLTVQDGPHTIPDTLLHHIPIPTLRASIR